VRKKITPLLCLTGLVVIILLAGGALWCRWPHYATLIVSCCIAAICLAALSVWRFYKRCAQCWPGPPNHNGIGVGAPKLYDTRSLSLMLEEMQDQVRRVSGIDQKRLTDSLNTVQGQRTSSSETTLEATFASGGGTDAAQKKAGQNKGDADKPKETPKATATTPKEGASNGGAGGASTPGTFAERSTDVLSDQVNLTYEILNLRLLLERALSDRLYGTNQARLQAVLGFPISVNTPEYASGCAAFVEVTVVVSGAEPPSVVALLPQEQTFNITTSRRRSGSVGASAPVKLANFALKSRALSERAYLDREADTIAFLGQVARQQDGSPVPQVTFGWQLRPGAGNLSVTAGLRQMFAVLSLPQKDEVVADQIELKISTTTYWRRFNSRTSTSSDRLNLKAWFSNRPVVVTEDWRPAMNVTSTLAVEGSLSPRITEVKWYKVGLNRAVIVVRGANFFPGTSVAVGDQAYKSSDDGLVLKSEKTLQLSVPLAALMSDAVLNGRYGVSVLLQKQPPLAKLNMDTIELSDRSQSNVLQLRLFFTLADAAKPLDWQAFSDLPDPLLQVNEQILDTPLDFAQEVDAQKKFIRVVCLALIPADLVPSDKCSVVLKFPFFGPDWIFRKLLPFPPVYTLTVIHLDTNVGLLISGSEFGDQWKVRLNKDYSVNDGNLILLDTKTLQLTVAAALLEKFDTLLVIPPAKGRVVVLQIPSNAAPAPMFDSTSTPLTVAVAVTDTLVTLRGSHLDQITKVTCGGKELAFVASSGGQLLKIEVKAEFASVADEYELVLSDQAGRQFSLSLLVTNAAVS
jgi:hypothetical protein